MLLIEAKINKGGWHMEIGSKLKNARNEKDMTQEHAAEFLGVSRQTISNWENSKTYPDIISVIKMSDFYSVSLDHLLKEDNTMNQTYQDFLEESTNTVKAKKNLSKIIILSTYFVVWIIAMILFWNVTGSMTKELDIILRWILLPAFLFVVTVTVAKNNYFGKGKWLCVIGAAIAFLTVPYTQFLFTQETETAVFTFRFPNISYMLAGILISFCGLEVGILWNKMLAKKQISN